MDLSKKLLTIFLESDTCGTDDAVQSICSSHKEKNVLNHFNKDVAPQSEQLKDKAEIIRQTYRTALNICGGSPLKFYEVMVKRDL